MQKVSITTPDLDDNNKPLEFDGIGLGVAGVDVNAIEQVRIHYAFYDSFVEVPVIKRYFNNASAKTEGMVSGAKYLVNNNIEDGATTAVLNVGGAYYDVYAGEPLPTGIEAGFTMTAGEVLDLNLGKAVRLQAIVKDESDEYKYINLTTGFDVVGLSVAGGGKTDVSAMIPSVLVDEAGKSYDKFYGLRLERISGVDVELGATVVHYAYVKLPEFPEEEVPYLVNMYLLPGAAYTPAGTLLNASYSATQKLNDKLLIKNSAVKPLLIKDNMSQAWRSGNGGGPSGSNDYAMLSIFRIKKMKNGTTTAPEYIGAISVWKNESGILPDHNWYYGFQKNGQLPTSVTKVEIPGPDAAGIIDFGNIELSLDATEQRYAVNGGEGENIISTEYYLYVHENTSTEYKTMEAGYELDFGEIVIPAITPEYEMAGVYSIDEIKNLDGTDSAITNPSNEVTMSSYKDYIEVVVPDMVDYKTVVDKVTLYRYENKIVGGNENAAIYQTVTRDNSGWTSAGDIKYVNGDGFSKIVIGTESFDKGNNAKNYYTAVVGLGLSEEYKKELDGVFPGNNLTINADYGWNPVKASEYDAPTLVHRNTVARKLSWPELNKTVYMLQSDVETSLESSKNGHAGAGDILYSQWVSVASTSEAMRYAAADDGMTRHTSFNDNGEYAPKTQYSETGTLHTANLYAEHNAELPIKYNVITRAYVPVLPTGFTADDIEPSYLVAESRNDGTAIEQTVTGVDMVHADEYADAEYYNLQGIRVANPCAGQIYLMRVGDTVKKVIIR